VDTSIVPRKQCTRKEQCAHPEAIDGWLPATLEYFVANKQGRYGLRAVCKACEHAIKDAKRVRRRHGFKRDVPDGMKHCYICGKNYPATTEYFRTRNRKTGQLAFDCFDCRNARTRQYRKDHPERVRAQATNKNRKRKLGVQGAHTEAEIKLLFRSQKGLCWWCGKAVDPTAYHVDHRVPLTRGGTDYAENLCITCPACNMSKHNKLPHEWNGRLL